MKWLPLVLDKKLFLLLSLAFMLTVVVGTLAHEAGHWLAATLSGFNGRIHFNSMTYHQKAGNLNAISALNRILITTAGPAQSMLVGTIGLILLILLRKDFNVPFLNWKQWLFILCSLFWLRQLVNFILQLLSFSLKDQRKSDEIRIAEYLHLPSMSISFISALVALMALLVCLFKFIPLKQRLTFLLSGIFGGSLGMILWMGYLGPAVLP